MIQKGVNFEQTGNKIFHANDYQRAKKLLNKLDENPNKTFICKGHWGKTFERDLLLSYKNIKIFLIWRNVKDVLVSHYFYKINKYGKKYDSFSEYYWTEGRRFLIDQMKYRNVWKKAAETSEVIESSFKNLKKKFL